VKDLFFDTETHTYYWKREKVPCVSDMLAMIDCITMKGIPAQNLVNASERGSRVHEATEDFEYGLLDMDEEWLAENEDIEPYVSAYIDWWGDGNSSMPIASEEPLFCEETGIAGTIDLVKRKDGELWLIDKKTSATLGSLRSILQLNIYRLNWNATHEEKISRLAILQLKKDGTYCEIEIPIDEAKTWDWIEKFREIKGDKKL
jgi:hypothetical protein